MTVTATSHDRAGPPDATAAPTVTADYLDGGTLEAADGAGVAGHRRRYSCSAQIPQPPVATPGPDAGRAVLHDQPRRLHPAQARAAASAPTRTRSTLATWVARAARTTQPTGAGPADDQLADARLHRRRSSSTWPRRPRQAAGSSTSLRSATPSSRSRPGGPACPLLPQFRAGSDPAEGELYVGVRDLHPPQNLALLFQVVDGTANPLVVKPEDHIHWTYLRDNEWVPFAADAVADGTDALLASGIVTLAVPADATTEHTLLPAGMHWIRLAVASESDAVCRLVAVAAQALRATYVSAGQRVDAAHRRAPGRHHHQARPARRRGEGRQPAVPDLRRPAGRGQPWRSPPGSASGCATRTGRSRCGTTST